MLQKKYSMKKINVLKITRTDEEMKKEVIRSIVFMQRGRNKKLLLAHHLELGGRDACSNGSGTINHTYYLI